MKLKKLIGLLWLVLCGTTYVVAQDAVAAGEQITSESSLVSGTEYLVYYVGNGDSGYMKDTGSAYTGKNDDTPTEAAVYVFTSNGDGTWTVQNKYTSKYWGTPTANANTYIGSDTGGSWALNFQTNGNVAPSCNGHSLTRSGSNVHPWSAGTANVNQFKICAVEEITTITATASEVYTLNNTNTSRGALIYNPDASTTYVWSSGKSGTFDATAANSQWVLYPTGTDGVYYLYNVGADKFAIPTDIAQSSSNAWIFSDNAVPVTFIKQSDDTYKIQMYTAPVSGTNAAYMAVSNSYSAPIINYNDEGGNFTVTKVDGNQSTAAAAAVARLAGSQTALTAAPTESGWYAVQIKSKSGSTSYAGRYLYNRTSLYNNLYPFGFTGGVDVKPAITDPTYYTYIDVTNGYWQAPDGRYLVLNSNNKFPIPSSGPATVEFGYNGGNYFKCGSYYADPYNSGTNYFFGETDQFRTKYNVYPINLTTAGLVAWKVTITNASEGTQLTCTRSDVSGLTAVYNNGTFFLPTDVTPASSDFSMDGMLSCTVDNENKTITAEYNPAISILASDVTVIQGNQTTGLGNTQQALLRVALTPFSDCTLTGVSATLINADQLSNVGAYITTNDELKYAGTEATTFSATNSAASSVAMTGSQALTAGTTYYLWITGDVSSTATEWNTIDAAITGISYTNDYTTANSLAATSLDLTSIGAPDGEMRIYSQQAFLWTPSNNNTKYYRIPTILSTADGGIVAFTDDRYSSTKDLGGHKIDVVMKKSTDNGATWSAEQTIAEGDGSSDAAYGYGDAAVARTANGKLVCIMAAGKYGFGNGMNHVGVSYSSDNGESWTEPTDIYSSIDFGDITPSSVFATAGKGVTFSNGRVAFAMNVMVSGTIYEYVLYSDNADEETPTWKTTTTSVYTGADESKLEIMNDNSLLVSVRRGTYNGRADRGYNRTTGDASGDGINTWGDTGRTWSDMNANGCNADILYYSRSTEDCTRPDVILHTLTKQYSTYRKDLRLYASFDQGGTWTEIFQLQPGYAAYSSMQKLANGDLTIIYEDGSIGNVDKQDCYAINYVVISSETLNARIDELYAETYATTVKNSVYHSETGCDTYGSFTDTGSGHWARTWTSNAKSGLAGLTVSTENGYGFDKATILSTRVMTLKPSADGATDTYTITAPEGYIIDSYTIGGAAYTSGTYRFTAADGTTTTGDITSTSSPTNMTVSNVNAQSTTFTFYGASQTSWLGITTFTITLKALLKLNVVGDASYATLYLPLDVTISDGTKAYYVETVADSKAKLTELSAGIPAYTAVVLINSDAATSTSYARTSGLTSVVSEDDNLLKGTLYNIALDLSDATPYYSLGNKGGIGFYKFQNGETTSITLGANRAYLDTTTPSGIKGFTLSWDNVMSSIAIPQTESTSTDSNQIFDLTGRRVSQPVRGLYIINGKKVAVK